MFVEAELKTWSKTKLYTWLQIYKQRYDGEGLRSLRLAVLQLEAQLKARNHLNPSVKQLQPFSDEGKVDFEGIAQKFYNYLHKQRIPLDVTDTDSVDEDGLPTLQHQVTVDNRLECTLSYRWGWNDVLGLYLRLPNGRMNKVWLDKYMNPTPWMRGLVKDLIMIEDTEELLSKYQR